MLIVFFSGGWIGLHINLESQAINPDKCLDFVFEKLFCLMTLDLIFALVQFQMTKQLPHGSYNIFGFLLIKEIRAPVHITHIMHICKKVMKHSL